MNVARSSAKLFAANVASTAFGLVGLLFFARQLGPSGFGAFVLFQSLVNILSFGSDLGVGSAIQKRLSEGRDGSRFFASGALLRGGLLLVTAIGLLAFRDAVNGYVGLDVTTLLVTAVVLSGANSLLKNALRGELRVGATAVLGVSSTFTWVLVGGGLVFAGFGVRGVIYGLVAGFAVQLLWALARLSTSAGRPSVEHARSLLAFAKYDFVGGVGSYVFNWVDVLVVGWLLTQSAVGTYEVAWRVAGVTLLLVNAIKTTVFPRVSSWYAAGEIRRIEDLINDLLTPALFFVLPAFAGVAFLARPILGLVFGPAYTDGAVVLVVLTGMKLVSAVHAIMVPCLLGFDRPDLNARATLLAVGLNVVLNVALVSQFGLLGAAVATTVALAANLALTTAYLTRFVTIRFPYREVRWCVVASLVMATGLYSVTAVVPVDTLPRLVLIVGFGAAVYGAVVLLSARLREQIRSNVHTILA